MALEIERKFLLNDDWKSQVLPQELNILSVMRIEQTYLALVLDEEIRVRKIEHESTGERLFFHTYKKGFGLQREEIEFPISQKLYEQLIENNGAPQPLLKTRTRLKWGTTTLEGDEYEQFELCVVEVEFTDIQEAKQFQAPSWFGKELSDSQIYSNKHLWKKIQGYG